MITVMSLGCYVNGVGLTAQGVAECLYMARSGHWA